MADWHLELFARSRTSLSSSGVGSLKQAGMTACETPVSRGQCLVIAKVRHGALILEANIDLSHEISSDTNLHTLPYIFLFNKYFVTMTAVSPVSPVSPTSSVSDRGDWSVAVWSPCVEGMDCATKYGIWYPAGYDISLPPISTQWRPVANLNPWLAPMIPRERRGRFMIDSMQLLPVDPYSCPSRIYRAVHAGHQSRGLRPRGDIRPNYWYAICCFEGYSHYSKS